MKKVVVSLVAVIMSVFMALTFVGCSSYSKIKSAFEKEGYTESEQVEKLVTSIKEDLEKDDLVVELHVLTKTLSVVIVCEFKSTEELAKAYKDSATMQGLVKDAKKSEDLKEMYKALEETGFVKGNCIVLPATIINATEVAEIVKNA